MYLFDTDVISHLFKKKPPPGLVGRLAAIPAREQFISTITVAEIVYGACKSERPVLLTAYMEPFRDRLNGAT